MPGLTLQRAAMRDAALIDALTEDFARELGIVLDLLTAKIRKLVRTIQTDKTGRIVATEQNLALALRMRADIIRELHAAGYGHFALRAVDAPLDRLAARVLKASKVELAAFDLHALVAMKELRLADLFRVAEDIAIQLWRITIDGVLGVRPVLDLVDDISDVLDISEKRARTIYDTAVSTFSRQVSQMGGTGKPDEAFLYVGPDDEKTRAFCQARVDRVYSRGAIDAMDNGQLPQPMLTGGGWNCRHQFKRVSKLDVELLALMDTGQRYQDRRVAA